MEFGIPKLRTFAKEKYENEGVLTFMPVDGEGKARRVVLNTKALELLNIEGESNQISFSFSGSDIYIVNTSGCENCAGLKIGKTSKSFSDKKHYEYIKFNKFNSTNETELEVFLIPTENKFKERTVFLLSGTPPTPPGINTEVEEAVQLADDDVAEKGPSVNEINVEQANVVDYTEQVEYNTPDNEFTNYNN